MTEEFFSPRLSGTRFAQHTVPVDILPDIAALQEMLVELAKAAFMTENPSRLRAPRNFNADVQIHLEAIEDGSAKLKLVLFFTTLVPLYQSAYQKAQSQITEAVEAVNHGQQPAMSPKYLAYFERVGRGLLEGESLDFPTATGYAPLNPATRQGLIQASQAQEWTERATLRVRVPMVDYRTEKYEVQLPDGSTVPGKLTRTIHDQLADAHHAYGSGTNEWLQLQCVVIMDRSDRIKGIDSVEHAALLDPLDVTLRLQELAELKDGWLDGDGHALPADAVKWLQQSFDSHFGAELPLPRLYPTPEGNVLAEWQFGRRDISLNIDLASRRAEFSVLDLDTEEARDEPLELGTEQGWKRLNETLSAEKPAEEIAS